MVADSTFIIEYLKNTFKDEVRLKELETPQQKAINVSCLHLCENDIAYAGVHNYRFFESKVRKGFCMDQISLTVSGVSLEFYSLFIGNSHLNGLGMKLNDLLVHAAKCLRKSVSSIHTASAVCNSSLTSRQQ